MINYIDMVKVLLLKEPGMSECPASLIDFYALLVLVVGTSCTCEHVHDAWSMWQNNVDASHRSLKPFTELTVEVQQLDESYRQAVIKVSKDLGNTNGQERGSKVQKGS